MNIKKDNKLLLKILSALAAIALWFAITYTEDPIISQYLTDIDIVFEGEDTLRENGLIVTNKESLPTISVTIRGNRSSVISAINNITASVNVSGINSAGENTAQISYNYPSSGVVLAKAKTRDITIETEKIVSRDIPVRTEIQNADKNEQYLIKATQKDDIVKIRGAESEVYSIAYAKVAIDAANILKTNSQEYFYKFYDENDDLVSSNNIIYRSIETISVDNEVFVRTALPVKVVLPEKLKEDNILTVKNQSLTSVDAGFSQNLNIEEFFRQSGEELYAYFDEEKKQEDGSYKLDISVPDGCFVPEENRTVLVTCELLPKVVKEVEIPISIQNVPEGVKVRLEHDKVNVSLKGPEDKLAASNVKATVDASGILKGENKRIEVKFEVKEDISVIGVYSAYMIAE